jgi:hypothetical protein
VAPAELASNPPIASGDLLRLVGLTKFARLMQRESRVTNATAALTVTAAEVPR